MKVFKLLSIACMCCLLVAGSDAHTVYALSMDEGKKLWQYTTGGRVDSPPTVYRGLVLFGCRDGRVYCLRASDGQLGRRRPRRLCAAEHKPDRRRWRRLDRRAHDALRGRRERVDRDPVRGAGEQQRPDNEEQDALQDRQEQAGDAKA